MYVSIGRDTVVRTDSVVGIFDLDITSQSHITRTYLGKAEKSGEIINAAEDIPKSFIVCDDRKVYLGQMSSSTLQKRIDNN